MGVNTARVYQGFITVGPFLAGGPEAYFGDVSTTTFVTKNSTVPIVTVLGTECAICTSGLINASAKGGLGSTWIIWILWIAWIVVGMIW